MRVAIVDDEELARRGLRSRLSRLADIEIVAECASGRAAIEAIRRTAPDLVFLDIQMPGVDGFGVVEAVGVKSFPYVVFVTAHEEHAIRAFEVNALDYLLKPIDDDRFEAALGRARRAMERVTTDRLAARLVGALRDFTGPQARSARARSRVTVRASGRVFFLRVSEIDWVQAAGDYVTLHVGKKEWLVHETLTAFSESLPGESFARIHRSAVVNIDRIAEMTSNGNGEYVVRLVDGTLLKLSRGYRDALERIGSG